MKRTTMLTGLMAWLTLAGTAQACENWNTSEFFETATAIDVQHCLDVGSDINATDGDGITTLHFAAGRNEDPEVIEVLVSAGADVHAGARYRYDGSMIAGFDSSEEFVLEGWTPLHYAAADNSSVAVIEALLAAGANVHAIARNGATPLHAAMFNTNPEFIKVLLAAGADVQARDVFGATTLHVAANFATDPEVIEVLLAAGADVQARDVFGSTALHIAAMFATDPEVIEVLLAGGADVHARDEDGVNGITALHAAAFNSDSPEVIEVLLAGGADVHARDGKGENPLHVAAFSADNPEVIGALLDGGADPAARTPYGLLPITLAEFNTAIRGSDAYRRLAKLIEPGPDEIGWAQVSGCTDLLEIRRFLAKFPESRHAERAQACEAWLEVWGD